MLPDILCDLGEKSSLEDGEPVGPSATDLAAAA